MTSTTIPRSWSPQTVASPVGDAVWAPSIHNSQPWRFRCAGVGVEVRLDTARRLAVCDPDGRAARISCGAAAYTLALALAMSGLPADCRLDDGDALVRLVPAPARRVAGIERRLYQQIHRRHTNREPFADRPIAAGEAAALEEAARQEGGWLHFVTCEQELWDLAALIRAADAQLNANPAYLAELRAWSTAADHRVEGVCRSAAGAAPHPAELLTRRDFGGPAHLETRELSQRPAVAVLGAFGSDPAAEVRAGMALQRLLLTAADAGLAAAMFSQPIEVPAIRETLRRSVFAVHDPQLVLRFGYAPTTCYTNRRPVAEVMDR
ncbi:Acg family FMN-binding oxidoreductase [Dactylosporangium sp. CA-233914]|uniref:Acg family FMN-binding oxidoreductase n=1 Tax=Dactylosporangium sp. CA-233914 TaxID=3239934 RepID=UPI003D8EB8B1